MVFGNLLGGIVEGIGQDMLKQKQRAWEDQRLQHQMAFDTFTNWLHQYGGDATPEELQAHASAFERAAGAKPGTFAGLVGFTRHVMPHVIPKSQAAPPPTGAGVQTSGQQVPESILAPSTIPQAAGQPPAIPPMPSRPQMQLNPQLTPEGKATVPPMPQMPTMANTFNDQQRQKMINEIDASDLGPTAKEIAKARLFGADIRGYETAQMKSAATAGNRGQFSTYTLPDGSSTRAFEITSGPHAGMTLDPNTMQPLQLPQGAVRTATHPDQYRLEADDAGNLSVINMNKATGVPVTGGVKGKSSAAFQGKLTPEATDMEAKKYVRVGKLTGLGMGGIGVKTAIMNRAAELYPDTNLADNQASFTALQADLTKISTNRDMVVAWEGTAKDNLQLLYRTAEALPYDTNHPIFNTPIREAEKKFFGSEEVAAFQTARRVATNEIAKAITNPGLTGQPTSDEARKEADDLIAGNYSLNQIYAAGKVLEADMKNRHDRLDDTIDALHERIKNIGTPEQKTMKQETAAAEKKPAPGGGGESKAPAMPTQYPVNVMIVGSDGSRTPRVVRNKEMWDAAVAKGIKMEVVNEKAGK